MLQWTLSDIIQKVRRTTGRPDASMMSDPEITDYINRYYLYVMPKELKIFWGYTSYTFYTSANIDQYAAPTTFQTLNPAAYADGFPIEWYLSPDTFYQDYPQQENKLLVDTGDGVTNSFTFTISAFPVLARSVYVTNGAIPTATQQVAQDNGSGGFFDPSNGNTLPGSIDYITGQVTGLQFTSAPPVNANIVCASQTYMANRPQGILFYKQQALTSATLAVRDAVNMFVLRPVPDQTYLIKMEGIQIPPELDMDNVDPNGVYTDVPYRTDLGPLIAYGASLGIFADFNQMDQYQEIIPQYTRYKDISMQDTYEEYIYQRSVPAF